MNNRLQRKDLWKSEDRELLGMWQILGAFISVGIWGLVLIGAGRAIGDSAYSLWMSAGRAATYPGTTCTLTWLQGWLS